MEVAYFFFPFFFKSKRGVADTKQMTLKNLPPATIFMATKETEGNFKRNKMKFVKITMGEEKRRR